MTIKRVGLVTPSLNVVVEDDLRRMLPEDVGYHIARLRLKKTGGRVTQEALLESGRDAVDQAGYLADAGVDAICFNCTGGSMSDDTANCMPSAGANNAQSSPLPSGDRLAGRAK